jgi:hypothetical protein
MRLYLHVTPAKGASFRFEHNGPGVRIGRDPASELALEGDTSQLVSWNHARIELSSSGAYLIDLKSTNGTFVNQKRVQDRSPLHQGDLIQLGQTGPTMKVVELDLDSGREKQSPQAAGHHKRGGAAVATPPAAPSTTTVLTKSLAATRGMLDAVQRTQRNLLIGMSVVGVALLAVVFVMLWKLSGPRSGQPDKPTVASTGGKQASGTADLDHRRSDEKTEDKAEKKTEDKAEKKTEDKAEKKTEDKAEKKAESKAPAPPPRPEPKAVGHYVSSEKGPPSVLLQRQHELQPWARLRPAAANRRLEDQVYTENYLVSLPGSRSTIYLDSNVHLTLLGNIREFSRFPPVYESAVVLHESTDGIDLDFTLERGRVYLANFKPNGEAHIRVHFQQQTWDVTLLDKKSEVVMELWGIYPPGAAFSTDPGKKGPLAVAGLFVRGQAQLKTGQQDQQQDHQLADLTQFAWANDSSAPMGSQKLPRLPDWWTNKPDQSTDAKDMMLGLIDLSKALDKNTSVVDTIRTEISESKDVANRSLSVWFLAAMDAIPYVVDALEDRQFPEVRAAASAALQNWIARSADHEMELYRTFQEKKGFSKEKADIIMQLLHDFSPADAADRKTYATLINYLDHDNLAIRQLALWHLIRLAPEGLKALYDPAELDAAKRKPAVEQWKKMLAGGKLPPKPPPEKKR